MNNIIAFIIGVVLVLFGFWVGGYNFDTRGPIAILVYVYSLIGGVLGILVVGMWKNF